MSQTVVVLKDIKRSNFGTQTNSQRWRRMSVVDFKIKSCQWSHLHLKQRLRNTATTAMYKLFISLLLVAVAIGFATSEKYYRYVYYQSENCKGSEAWSIIIPTRCRVFNGTYSFSSCDPDGVRHFKCGSDSTCKSCTQTSIDKYGCGKLPEIAMTCIEKH